MPIYIGRRTAKNVGDVSVPQDVKRRRRQVYDMLRRMGTPVVIKHRYNDLDTKNERFGGAIRVQDIPRLSEDVATDIYDQVRNWDPLSWGVGFVGAKDGEPILWDENDPNAEFFDPNWDGFQTDRVTPDHTFIWRRGVDGDGDPPAGYYPAPKYRGYGPGNLTYIIMPDRAEDYFKADTNGPLFKVQEAFAIAPWFPEVNDNDLIIPVEVNANGQINELDGYGRLPLDQRWDRFEAKMADPISMRGIDRSGRREQRYTDTWGNRHMINQTFEMALLPFGDVSYQVEVDR